MKARTPALLLTLFVLLCQAGWVWVDGRPPEGDAGQWHVQNLRHVLGEAPASLVSDYYPPLVYWLAAPACLAARALTGGWDGDVAVLAMLAAWTPLLAWAAWRLGGLPAVALTLTTPGVLAYGREFYLEYPLAAAVLWATAELAEDRPRWPWLALALLTCAMVKWSFAFYLLGAVPVAAWRWRRDARRAAGSVLLAAGIAWLWYAGRWETILHSYAVQPNPDRPAVELPLVAAAVMLTWPWLATVLLALASRRSWALVAQAAVAMAALMTAHNPDARYVLPCLPLLTCAAGAAAGELRWLRRAMVVPVLAGLLACFGWVGWLQAGGVGERRTPYPILDWAASQQYARLHGWWGWKDAPILRPWTHAILGATPDPAPER